MPIYSKFHFIANEIEISFSSKTEIWSENEFIDTRTPSKTEISVKEMEIDF